MAKALGQRSCANVKASIGPLNSRVEITNKFRTGAGCFGAGAFCEGVAICEGEGEGAFCVVVARVFCEGVARVFCEGVRVWP